MIHPAVGLRKQETVSTTPKGTNYVRRIIATALADGEGPRKAMEIARKRWGPGSPVADYIVKADKPAGATSGGWGTDLLDNQADTVEFFAATEARSIAGQLPGIRRVPFHIASLGIVAGTGVNWVQEGYAVPVSNPIAFRVAGLPPRTLASIVPVTMELLRDSDPKIEAVIRADLMNSVAFAENTALLDPSNSGVANTKPAALTDGAGSSDSPGAPFDSISALIEDQNFEGDLERSVLLMHPATAARQTSPTNPGVGARGGTMLGFPVIVSSAIPLDIVVLLDPTAVLFASENNGDFSTSMAGTLGMTDTPTANTIVPTAVTQVSLFQTATVAVQLRRRVNWAMARPNCISYATVPTT
jgi:hypothetical protein